MNFIFKERLYIFLIALCFISLFLKNSFNTLFLSVLICYSIYFFVINRKFKLINIKAFFILTHLEVYFPIYFLICLFSLLYTSNISEGLSYISRYLVFIFIPISFYILPIDKGYKDGVFVRKSFIITLYLVFLFLVFNALLKNEEQGNSLVQYIISNCNTLVSSQPEISKAKLNFWLFTYEGLSGPINIQPIYLALFTNLALVFLIALKISKNISRFLFWFLFLQFILFNLLLSSRTESVICAILIFIYLLLRSNTKTKLVQSFFIGIFGILIIFFIILRNPILKYRVLTVFDSSITHKYLNFSNQNVRIEKWKNGMELVSKAPIFGYGIGDAKEVLLKQYKENGFDVGVSNKYNSHNQFIEIWLQSGIFGLFVIGALFFKSCNKKSKHRLELRLICAVFFLSFFTESILGRHWGIVSFVLFICFVSKYKLAEFENRHIRN